jgi:hypothetical protein
MMHRHAQQVCDIPVPVWQHNTRDPVDSLLWLSERERPIVYF